MKDLVHQKKGTNPYVGYITRRIRQNKNFLACFTGGTGSGKSYSAIRLGELVSKEMGVSFDESNIVFEPSEFMRLMNSGNLRKGSVIILDEAGVVINARKWMTTVNMMINYVTQTFRHRNYVTIFCVPDFSFIDKAIRKLFHSYLETVALDLQKGVCWCKPFLLQNNQRTGDTYYKYLRYQPPGGAVTKLERVGFSMADSGLLKVYEDKKRAFTDKLNQNIQSTLEKEEQQASGRKELTDLQAQAVFLRMEGLTQKQIAEVMGVSRPQVSVHLSASNRKGYDMPSHQIQSAPGVDIDGYREKIQDIKTIRRNITIG